MAISPESFLRLLEKSKLLSAEQFADAQAVAREVDSSDPRALAKALVLKDLITRWQAAKLLSGASVFFMGKYKLLDQLGRGGMGGVFLAEHRMMNRTVALKVISKQLGKDPASLERFFTEARAIAAVDHPNIAHAYDVDKEGERYYLVMEYIEGNDLQRIVEKEGPLKSPRAVDYVRQAAEGLAHAHSKGMIHCDIKPANLLVNRQGAVKILDMGMARLIGREDSGDSQERVLGTVDYMAPEQALEGPDLDHRVDIYSLGCTLYFLLTGKPPFPEGSIHERIVKHQSQQPPSILKRRPNAPKDLVEICEKMMAKTPADRYQTAAEVVEVLGQWQPPAESLKRAEPLEPEETPAAEPMAAVADDDPLSSYDSTHSATKRPSSRGKAKKGAGAALPMDKLREFFKDRRRAAVAGAAAAVVLLLVIGLSAWAMMGKTKPVAAKGKDKAAAKSAQGAEEGEKAEKPDPATARKQPGDEKKTEPDPKKDTRPIDKSDPDAGKAKDEKKAADKPADAKEKQAPDAKEKPKKAEESKKTEEKKSEAKKDAAAKEPPKEKPAPPKPPAPKPPEPFKDFPKFADLPETEGEVAKIHTAADEPWELSLEGGETVLKGNKTFLMELKDEGGKPSWPVQLNSPMTGKDPTVTDVGRFYREGSSLQFQWLEGTPPAIANQLRLCKLQVRAGSDARTLPLCQPQEATPGAINPDRVATISPAEFKWLPESSRLRVHLTRVEGLKDWVIKPSEPVKPNEKIVITFMRKDPRTKAEQPAVSVLAVFNMKGAGAMAINTKLPDKTWPAKLKQAATFRGTFDEQLAKANRELGAEKVDAKRKPMLEMQADQAGLGLALADFYDNAKSAKIHYRVLAEVGEELVEVALTPGANQVEKAPPPPPPAKKK